MEELPTERRFDAVTMRAVERMAETVEDATGRVRDGGWMAAVVGGAIDVAGAKEFLIPESGHRRLLVWRNVPRGTSAS